MSGSAELGEHSSSPFAALAQRYWEMGLPVIPCGGADGKKPLIKWASFQKRLPTKQELGFWIKRYPEANIGLVTGGVSRVTVIDSDNPEMRLDALFERFGETPLVAYTPRGGYHLYYRHSGERNTSPEIEKVDMRGEGGFVVAPPSYNPLLKKSYQFVSGGLADVENLPSLKNSNNNSDALVSTGNRNKTLFSYLKEHADAIESFEALENLAHEHNTKAFSPPLPEAEIRKTAKSVWSYKENGKLFKKGEQSITVRMRWLEPVKFSYPRAFTMYCDLLACHGNMRKEFAISLDGYQKRCGWDIQTIRETIKVLMDADLIIKTHKGGRCAGDASLYSFT